MSKDTSLLIFTDLDGTLLDFYSYSAEASRPALNAIKRLNIPLVIATSKTRIEVERLLDILDISKIFITENGSGIFLPEGFKVPLGMDSYVLDDYQVIPLGPSYSEVLSKVSQAKRGSGVQIKGFSDMTPEEIASLTGLDIESAMRATKRDFSEPFVFDGQEEDLKRFIKVINSLGLSCMKGNRFYHIIGNVDKGKAAKIILKIYRDRFSGVRWKTVALGDSPNDVPLFRVVDLPILIRRLDNSYVDLPEGMMSRVIRTSAVGPQGWNDVMLDILDKEVSVSG